MEDKSDQKVVLTLRVPSLEETVTWYEDVLGWTGHYDVWNEQGKALFGSVSYQHDPFAGFNLSRREGHAEQPGEKCDHIQAWIYVRDVDAVYDRLSRNSREIVEPPQNQFWGERTFRMRDLNGIELVFAQPAEEIDLEEIRRRHKALLR